MIIQVSSTAVPMHPAVPARLADRYRVLRADTASRVTTATSIKPVPMAAAIGTGQVHARPLTSATAQHEPTTGPLPSSLRAALRAGCVQANSAAISPGSPNSATAARGRLRRVQAQPQMVPVGLLQPVSQFRHDRRGQLAGQRSQVLRDQIGSGHGPPSRTALTVAANSRHAVRRPARARWPAAVSR